jgi:glycine/D-amino acid oxidase-like deaminating enzyme
MIEKDYIIVGLGIAGISICEQMQRNGKTFVAIDGGQEGATAKSGGVFNPTVLKRFTAVWNAAQFVPVATAFYNRLSQKLQTTVFEELSVVRIFKSIAEQNNWSVASDKIDLREFLSPEFVQNTNPAIEAPLGFGEVLGTAKIKPMDLLQAYKNHLKTIDCLVSESFQYELLREEKDKVVYNGFSARKIIFAEGAKAIENPFFPNKTIIGNKGEYVIIKAPQLKLETFLKGPVYVIPQGNDKYKVGATYSRDDYSTNATPEASAEILSKLKTFIHCDFGIIGQTAGVRPTTKDRRPLLGSLPQNPNIVFFNGLGSRGFLMAPLLSEMLYEHLEAGEIIPQELDINRFKD